MLLRAIVILISGVASSAAFAQCDANAFRAAVAGASASLTELHEKNNRLVQEKLRSLRALYNWSDAEYVAKAAPFVKDETTASLDAANQALLVRVQSLEAGNANTEAGRCAMLGDVKVAMEKVVANTAAKWDHMISKLTEASSKALQAGMTQ